MLKVDERQRLVEQQETAAAEMFWVKPCIVYAGSWTDAQCLSSHFSQFGAGEAGNLDVSTV